jgi:hypothetical protein
MSLTNSKLSVETIVPEGNITYYVALQAANTGKSAVDYVSPLLTYNTGLGSFFVNNRVVPTSNVSSLGSIVTSPTPPPNPAVGDLWYDSSSDIQFEYVNDGVNRQWVDITGPTMSIGGPVSTNNFTYLPFTATANPTTTRNLNAGDPVNFSTFTSVTGGYTAYPYTYYIVSGTLPIGLTLNPDTGIVSGIAQRAYTTASVVFGVRDILNFAVTTSVTFNVVLNIQYLVVAGGGGGGSDRGSGGGAGGLRFGSVTCLSNGTTITIRVGAGGAGGAPGAGPLGKGAPGHSSNIVSSAFGTVSTVGGGGGGSVNQGPATPQNGFAGGSGGGAGGQPVPINPSSGGAGTFGAGTGFPGILGSTQQGFPGGLSGSNTPGAPPCGLYGAGGGGGAGAAGGNGIGPLRTGGAGGIGYLWPYTNSYYAGGGGGSFCSGGPTQPGIPGPGGLGGGGAGANSMLTGTAGTAGTANFGGGGGGGAGSVPQGQGGVGGSGTVIIIIPTPAYFSGTTNGSVATTPPAAPGYTALTYSATNPTTPSVFIFTT